MCLGSTPGCSPSLTCPGNLQREDLLWPSHTIPEDEPRHPMYELNLGSYPPSHSFIHSSKLVTLWGLERRLNCKNQSFAFRLISLFAMAVRLMLATLLTLHQPTCPSHSYCDHDRLEQLQKHIWVTCDFIFPNHSLNQFRGHCRIVSSLLFFH